LLTVLTLPLTFTISLATNRAMEKAAESGTVSLMPWRRTVIEQ
jgi:hypothetical protein